MRIRKEEIRSILIVKPSSMGDVLHTLPSLVSLRKCFPKAYIAWAIEEAAAPIVLGNPLLNEVFVSRRTTWEKGIFKSSTIREFYDFIKTLRSKRFDVAIDFHGQLRTAIITRMSGAKIRIGYDRIRELGCHFFYNHIVHMKTMNAHAVDRYYRLAMELGCPASGEMEFPLPISESDKQHVSNLLAGLESREKRFVVLHASSRRATNIWPPAKYAELGSRLARQGLGVVLTGAKSEDQLIRSIAQAMDEPPLCLHGQATLLQSAEVIRRAAAYVSSDTGTLHIAVAVKAPIITLFGATDPQRTGPYGSNHTILRSGVECSPCFARQCDDLRCLHQISVDEVFDAVMTKVAGEINQAGKKL